MTTITRNRSTIDVDEDNMTIIGNYNKIRNDGSYSGITIKGNYNEIYIDGCTVNGNYNELFSNGCNVIGNYNNNHGTNNFCTGNYNEGKWSNRKNDFSKPNKVKSDADIRATLEREYEARLAEEKKKMYEQEERIRKEKEAEASQKKLKNETFDLSYIVENHDKKKMSSGNMSSNEMLRALQNDKDANERLQETLGQLEKQYLLQRDAVIKSAYKKTIESKQKKLEEQAAEDLKEAEELMKQEQLEKNTEKDQSKLMMQMLMQMQQGQQQGYYPGPHPHPMYQQPQFQQQPLPFQQSTVKDLSTPTPGQPNK